MTLAWAVKLDEGARRDLKNIDKAVAGRITAFLRERIATLADPRAIDEALKGAKFGEFW